MKPEERLTHAISIRQPFVELILRGVKVHEYRGWYTNRRGRVYLYASQTITEYPPEITYGEVMQLPKGLIVGSVEIVDCRTWEEGEWAGYAFHLARPRRYTRTIGLKSDRGRMNPIGHVTAQGYAQPGFWKVRF